MRKPYFITGDDGLKKRMDLYKVIAKDGMQELGTIIFYTNEKGKKYTALQPNFTADSKVWERYFEDIHLIDKEEKNFVLKLSYILSKEMSFQLYKAINKGKDMKEESATYGSDICFPGDQLVAMADGSKKQLDKIRTGDRVLTIEPVTKKTETARTTLEADILSHINKYRQSKGLPDLVANPAIAAQAEKHSAGMASKRVAFGHDGFEERVRLITQQIGVLRLSAENVAYGKLNAKEVVDIWLKSAGHKKNIEGKYQLTGIGIATDKQGTIFFTQIFATK
jgi:uncharacterized protein YkwD